MSNATPSPDKIGASLAKDMPPVTVTAPPAAAPSASKTAAVFDPAKHKANADGSPRLDKAGRFVPVNTGRPKGSAKSFIPPEPSAEAPDAAAEAAPAGDGAPPPPAEKKGVLPNEKVADVAARAAYAATGAVIKDHAAAKPAPEEHENLRDMLGSFLDGRGLVVAGGVALGLGFAAYLLDDKRREKLVDAVAGFFKTGTGKTAPKAGGKPAPGSQSERQPSASGAPVAPVSTTIPLDAAI